MTDFGFYFFHGKSGLVELELPKVVVVFGTRTSAYTRFFWLICKDDVDAVVIVVDVFVIDATTDAFCELKMT